DAWQLFKGRPGKWIVSFLLIIVAYFIVALIPIIGSLISALMWPFIGAGVVYAADLQRRTGTFDFDALVAGVTKRPGPPLAIGCLVLLLSIVFVVIAALAIGFDLILKSLSGQVNPSDLSTTRVILALLVYLVLALPLSAATYFAPPLIMLNDISLGAAMR